MDKALKITTIIAVLFMAFAIFYYLVIFLPQKERTRLEAEKEQQEEELRRQEAKERKEEAEEETQQVFLDACLLDARASYETTWTSNCESIAEEISSGITGCMRSEFFTREDCEGIWGKPDNSPDCTLPADLAESVDDYHKELRDDCFKKYPPK